MPGPANRKNKKSKKPKARPQSELVEAKLHDQPTQQEPDQVPIVTTTPPLPPEVIPIPAILHDPGNGPRVLDLARFLQSVYADPITTSDPKCMDFTSPEVLPILFALLPPDGAQILHYNKTRARSRICPACRRLYRLGETLRPHLDDGSDAIHEGPQTLREQAISGICSWMCFGACAFKWPGCLNAWGNMAIDMDYAVIEYMNGPGDPQISDEEGLGQFLRMTRNEGLGLEPYRQACYIGSSEDSPQLDEDPGYHTS